MAKTAGVQLSIDTATAQQHWDAVIAAMKDLRDAAGKAKESFDTVQVVASPSAQPGTITFTANASVVVARLGDLKTKLNATVNEVDQLIAILNAGLSVTVQQVN